ncbi:MULTISPECIES: succinate dehydrogenase, hydrophobic membrane anchor protein [Sphingomonadales]|uniref:Succinate dehydrogenase hydrophobic membrane anchor subunit n=2 Tax=Edaphosphingomonas TaxID=3423724 RepID=A0A2T4HWA4_9SPHN|nr:MULTISPECIES: succinate dehydrogenase, hydrophobic membrane anchor protein [Sphingomonas]AGH48593.1 succinate dehydrogenase hydrophobic membrane anchor protein [Sphingomonas sp. MM-1]MDX3885586.1 succinate dehydrogenase, hydrophobic membrane anchor protein [Sphingomonas sp.]OHT21070.1 Succinate dehydrogenase/Fumarate reductase transmembrane subunit [Sphingomonas haloaromaticamans]PTD20040.1 succinate dehydrogenase, hydrophobic membrane anchor protein [Sphingomonas fennica]
MGTGTGIGRVRGLGSAKHGSLHWWQQRLTAAGNVILLLWFVVSIFRLPVLDYATVTTWIGSPFVAVALVLLTVSVFWHLRLGLQVFIEDYVHDDASRVAALLALNFYAVGSAALAIFSILKIAFGGVHG